MNEVTGQKITISATRDRPGWWHIEIVWHLSGTGSGSSRPPPTAPYDHSSATPAALRPSCPSRCLRLTAVCCKVGRLWCLPGCVATWREPNKESYCFPVVSSLTDACNVLIFSLCCVMWAITCVTSIATVMEWLWQSHEVIYMFNHKEGPECLTWQHAVHVVLWIYWFILIHSLCENTSVYTFKYLSWKMTRSNEQLKNPNYYNFF